MRSTPLPLLFVALLATLWGGTAHAEPPAAPTDDATSTRAAEPLDEEPQIGGAQATATAPVPHSDGLRIYRDPETGAWLEAPTPEQEQALNDKLLGDRFDQGGTYHDDAGLVPFALEGGGRGVFLAGRFTSALWVHRHADGTLHLACDSVDGAHAPGTPSEGALPVADEPGSIPTDAQGSPLQ